MEPSQGRLCHSFIGLAHPRCSVYVCQATGHHAGGWGPDWADTPWNTRSEKGTRVGYAAGIAYPGGGAFKS